MTLTPQAADIQARARELLDRRKADLVTMRAADICAWGERRFYIVDIEGVVRLITLLLHQKAVLRAAFTRNAAGRLPYTNVLLSTVKKSGKTALAALIARWMAETQTRMGQIAFAGNDLDQAKGRAFAAVVASIRLTPGTANVGGEWILPGQWVVQKTMAECLTTGTVLKAVAVDARGEAGGNQDLTCWTELWGFTLPEAMAFYQEMTPVPTKLDSVRLVETYAGYEGESKLLEDMYDIGMVGRQMTNGELAAIAARDLPGESYEDFLYAFIETAGDPDAPVPVWVNEQASQITYWDSGVEARRMPWQQGERGAAYYTERALNMPTNEFERHNYNRWVGAQAGFIPIEWWYDCYDPNLPELAPGDPAPAVLGADAAVTSDCFGVVLVTRHPDPALHDTHVAVRACRKWDPADSGGKINLQVPEDFIRTICKGGCRSFHPVSAPRPGCPQCADETGRIPAYNVKQLPYDPYQMISMAQRLIADRVVWAEPFNQGKDRLEADSALRAMILHRQVRHGCAPPGHPAHDPAHPLMELRQHITNAAMQLQKTEDSRLRIVKKAPARKIDLVIALSMAASRCLYLRL